MTYAEFENRILLADRLIASNDVKKSEYGRGYQGGIREYFDNGQQEAFLDHYFIAVIARRNHSRHVHAFVRGYMDGLHHEFIYQQTLYRDLLEAGREFGLANCGMRALLKTLRLEKGYLLGPDFAEETPLQAGLDAFVKFDKGDFIGREALREQKEQGIDRKLVLLAVEAGDADAYGDECLWLKGQAVGRVTSGGWGHRVGKSLALAYIRPELAAPGTKIEVEILDERRPAGVVKTPLYDPENARLNS